MSFLVSSIKDYLYPPAEFNMLKCLIDGVSGTCYTNFQKMSEPNRKAIIKKTISAAIAAGLVSCCILGSGSAFQVAIITGLLIFAMETCPYGQLNIDLSRLRN
ncbi:hypothetical protein [Criblamydia sequanensis]|uniref:Membrane protein n=1 Tax=Candidatus Criblamydia sequanensis CRIB-18 TaxID=1437425 RepID=A0A090DY27_9BACT|nr:hypothetical protein [Criblamydia sequanensis]CDR33664.1 Putative membrane protein [Criblamydia sequanensis CRIB-18]